jgi:acyl carrier protein
MDREQISQKLREIIEPYVQDKEAFAQLNEQTDLLKDLKINSANLVDIILDVEDAFDVEIDDESAEKMLTVEAALDIIRKKVQTS